MVKNSPLNQEFVEFCITNNLSTNRWGGGIGLLRVMDCMDNLD